MGSPAIQDIEISQSVLQNIAIGVIQDRDQVTQLSASLFPRVPVDLITAKYRLFNRDMSMSQGVWKDMLREGESVADAIGYTLSSDSYTCRERAREHHITQQMRDEAKTMGETLFDLETVGGEMVPRHMLLGLEGEAATVLTTAGNYSASHTVTLSGTDQWSDAANSDPIGDIELGKQKVLEDSGNDANWLYFRYDVFVKLRVSNQITGELGFSPTSAQGKRRVTPEDLMEIFGIPNVIISRARKLTSDEGQATETHDYILGKHAGLCYVDPNATGLSATFGKLFNYTGREGGGMGLDGVVMDKYDTESNKVRHIRGTFVTEDPKITFKDAGYNITDAIA